MKLIALLAASAALILAQDAKVVPSSPSAKPTERPLSETESLKLQLSVAQIQLLQKEYKIEEYQAKIKPYMDSQQAIALAACGSVGVAEDKITTECGLSTGIGPDGKPAMDANGKPVQARVWHAIPAPPEKK